MSDEPKVYRVKVADLLPDEGNANLGTQRGRYMLEQSLQQLGAGRSILLDRDGRVIAGNKTREVAGEVGLDSVIVVETDGNELVAVKRTDLDLEEGAAARRLAYYDNRTGEADLAWSPEQLLADLEEGVELEDIWFDWELEKMIGSLADEAIDPNEEWQGMPEFEREPLAHRTIYIHFKTPEDVSDFAKLMGQKITDATKSLWYPKQEKRDIASQGYITNES